MPDRTAYAVKSKSAVLPTRRLGRTGMDITRAGFGAWAIGGTGWAASWGAQDDKESVAAIRHAVERGINWIDTAAIYGLGHSEEIVRAALLDIPAGPMSSPNAAWSGTRRIDWPCRARLGRRKASSARSRLR